MERKTGRCEQKLTKITKGKLRKGLERFAVFGQRRRCFLGPPDDYDRTKSAVPNHREINERVSKTRQLPNNQPEAGEWGAAATAGQSAGAAGRLFEGGLAALSMAPGDLARWRWRLGCGSAPPFRCAD